MTRPFGPENKALKFDFWGMVGRIMHNRTLGKVGEASEQPNR